MTTVTTLAINAITDQGELLHLLGRLAARWRFAGMDELAEEQAAIEHEYASAIHRLLELGYNEPGGLDVESELPDAVMPQEYRSRFAE